MAKSYGITDIGNVRKNNEDNYFLDDYNNVYVVADGMGGHAGGEEASKIVVFTFQELVEKNKNIFSSEKDSKRVSDLKNFLCECFSLSNRRIYEETLHDTSLMGMGTTCTACAINGREAVFSHIGDSRAYIFSNGEIAQVTEDHSYVYEQVKKGVLTKKQAETHFLKNVITRSLGVGENIEIDVIVKKN
ncbi:MAG: protein phosphatase 2C domain-containing protein [Pseudomonadota bacterium]